MATKIGYRLLYWLGMGGSLLLCALFLPARFPGMTLMGYGVNWLLIWLVGWSLRQPIVLAVGAGIAVGFLQDAMTIPTGVVPSPSHAWGFAVAGGCAAMLQKQRYIQEDFISIAMIVFGMTIITETVNALLWTFGGREIVAVWTTQQRIALCSAIVTSLWSPILYFPMSQLRRWFYVAITSTNR